MLLIKLLALVAIVPWCISPFFALLLRQFVPKFDEVAPRSEPRGGLPRLSVLIPACNEATTIERALRTLLKQSYPNLEVVVVNDRSDDETGAIIDRLANEDHRIRTVHIDHLPEGWLGKVYALKMAAKQASGEWLLCSDADIHFAKDCLKRAVLYAEQESLDHLSLLPTMTSRSMLARFSIVSAMRGILLAVKPWHVNDSDRPEGLGVGAFNMVRRVAFEDTTGFEWFKMDVADDVALGQMMKNATGRSHILIANDAIEVEWYPSVEKVFLGLEKNAFAQVARCDFHRGLLTGALVIWVGLAPLILFAMGETLWSVIPWIGALATGIILKDAMGMAIIDTLGSYFIGDIMMGAVVLRSTWLGRERGGVIWRGTVYTSEELQTGMRVQFGDWLTNWLNRFR